MSNGEGVLLPELPEPAFMVMPYGKDGYSAEQMRAYGEQCRAQGVEDRARLDWLERGDTNYDRMLYVGPNPLNLFPWRDCDTQRNYETLRAAIDAAMIAATPIPGGTP